MIGLRVVARRVLLFLCRSDEGAWLMAAAGCCACGTGGPYYRGWRRPVTRYAYTDATGPGGGDRPDWVSCSAHPVPGRTPVLDYGRDRVVTNAQVEMDVLDVLWGGAP